MFKENSKAIYLQIADRICDDILAGTLKPGDRLPSVREQAAAVQVNPNTMMRTYDHLASSEVIFNRRGIGYFLSEDAPEKVREMKRKAIFGDEILSLFRQLELLGVDADTLKARYEKFLKYSTDK
ncbi:MAG: GntR family transcriptional regulator [Muribaculaceae bacterium]|nr:GntR family transcriptional regulator [Muribaculaceae bacterium]